MNKLRTSLSLHKNIFPALTFKMQSIAHYLNRKAHEKNHGLFKDNFCKPILLWTVQCRMDVVHRDKF